MNEQGSQTHLGPTGSIESDHPAIRAMAASLTEGASDRRDEARRLFFFVRDAIRYNPFCPFFLREHYRASAILARGQGYCVQKAVLLAALARARDIPARLIFVDIRNHRSPAHLREAMGTDLFVYHCYVEWRLGDEWIKVAPVFDRPLCLRHGFPVVDFDGVHDALFPPLDVQGRPFVEYVRRRGTFDDVPLEDLARGWEEAYGRDRVDLWREALVSGEEPDLMGASS